MQIQPLELLLEEELEEDPLEEEDEVDDKHVPSITLRGSAL